MIVGGYRHVLPHKDPNWRYFHLACLVTLAANFLSNYMRAVLTDPGTARSATYGRLLLAARGNGQISAADCDLQQEGSLTAQTLSDPDILRRRVDPFDWSFCLRSRLLKPPRAHFDGVTNQLVVNFDHYCVRQDHFVQLFDTAL